jgi:hypothetical protein
MPLRRREVSIALGTGTGTGMEWSEFWEVGGGEAHNTITHLYTTFNNELKTHGHTLQQLLQRSIDSATKTTTNQNHRSS